jgi:hypothetical protein
VHFDKLSRGEIIAIVGGILLGIGVFLTWYASDNHLAVLAGKTGPRDYSAWDAHKIIRLLLLAGAVAPLILAYIIVRDHQLSWPRGQLTAVVAITALGLMFYVGIIDRPGDPRGLIHLRIGWFVSMAGALLMLIGSNIRQSETELVRKPPGTI